MISRPCRSSSWARATIGPRTAYWASRTALHKSSSRTVMRRAPPAKVGTGAIVADVRTRPPRRGSLRAGRVPAWRIAGAPRRPRTSRSPLVAGVVAGAAAPERFSLDLARDLERQELVQL